jgi:diacylglycerol O-acyltransferase
MNRMPLADAFFLVNESRQTPMHVGGLALYTLPTSKNDTEFLEHLKSLLRDDSNLRHPFGKVLKMGPTGALGPVYWEEDDLLDIDYHINHFAVPKPGRYRELFALVSRLHGHVLDRSRPLWEMHLIEGLRGNQFAIYLKIHHCAVDGAATMHLINSMHTNSHRSRVKYSPFSVEAEEAYREKLGLSKSSRVRHREDEVKAVVELLREQLGSTVNVGKALAEYASAWLGSGKSKLSVPFRQVPHSSLSTEITGARRFVAQSWPFARVRGLGKALDATLNDTVLAMCAGALRRYLQDQGELPEYSLKAQVPVSLRAEGDLDSANAIGFLMADLATNETDPERRLHIIKDSMDAAKSQMQGMNRREIDIYNAITQIPVLVASLTGIMAKIPAYSLVVSNVPGPREQMYWDGARLDGLYPVNIPFHGFALSITLVSNNKNLDFGMTACRRSLPHVQRLIGYMEEALVELEEVAGIASNPSNGGSRRKAPPKTKAKTKPKSSDK